VGVCLSRVYVVNSPIERHNAHHDVVTVVTRTVTVVTVVTRTVTVVVI